MAYMTSYREMSFVFDYGTCVHIRVWTNSISRLPGEGTSDIHSIVKTATTLIRVCAKKIKHSRQKFVSKPLCVCCVPLIKHLSSPSECICRLRIGTEPWALPRKDVQTFLLFDVFIFMTSFTRRELQTLSSSRTGHPFDRERYECAYDVHTQ